MSDSAINAEKKAIKELEEKISQKYKDIEKKKKI
jgi:hypothetical protein